MKTVAMMRRSGAYMRAVCFVCLLTLPLITLGQLPASITRAVQWLVAQVDSVGALHDEANSVATSAQTRSEAAQSLKLLAQLPAPLQGTKVINDDPVDQIDTETLARRIVGGAQSGEATDTQIAELRLRANPDGGFGGARGYQSHPMDTAWAVLAFAQAGLPADGVAVQARRYLAGQAAADGGMGSDAQMTAPVRLYLTALVDLALQTGAESESQTAARGFSQYLAARQGVDGGWVSDTLVTAWVLQALAPASADATMKTNATAFLESRQNANGSWNGDPYVTAVALRALAVSYNGTSAQSNAGLAGSVQDSTSGLPLAGVQIAVSGAGVLSQGVSGSDGAFTTAAFPAGSYTLTLSRAGYQAFTQSISVVAGQTINVGLIKLSPTAATGIVRGTVTAQASNTALGGATLTLQVGSTSLTATTDTSGRFEFSAVPPGSVTLVANSSGFQGATFNTSLAGGQTLNVYAALIKSGDPLPTSGPFLGKVVNAGTKAALQGVAVRLVREDTGASTSLSSADDGSFSTSLQAAVYNVSYSLSGYVPAQQRFVLSAGAAVDVGVVPLTAQKTATTISGRVTAQDGSPVSGAALTVLSSAGAPVATATADVNGYYSLTGLAGTNISVRASAQAFESQTVSLSVPAPTDLTQNFVLAAQNGSTVRIDSLTLDQTALGANSVLTGAVVVSNSSTTASVSVTPLFVVADSAGTFIGKGGASDSNGAPLGIQTIPAGGAITLSMKWNSGTFAPGAYALIPRMLEPGSATSTNPSGNILAQRSAAFAIQGTQAFVGSVTVNPPVLRAGTGGSAKLSALIQNNGNIVFTGGTFHLEARDTKTGALAFSQDVSGADMARAGLQNLDFGAWSAPAAGDYAFTLSFANTPSLGSATGHLYVGGASAAAFTVSKSLVPTGDQTVRGAIAVTGQDVVLASVVDPLVPLIKAAIQKSVDYGDTQATAWTKTNQCLGCHVQSQAIVGGELTRKMASFDAVRRNQMISDLTVNQNAAGVVDMPWQNYWLQSQTLLSLWAANAISAKDQGLLMRTRAANYVLGHQDADGGWTPEATYYYLIRTWWQTRASVTGFHVKNLVDLAASVKQNGNNGRANEYVETPFVSGGVINGAYFIASDAQSNIYSSNAAAGTLTKTHPDGTSETLITGVPWSTGVVVVADGTIYLAAPDGLRKRDSSGVVTKLSSLRGDGLSLGPDGNLYMTDYNTGNLYRITPAGTVTILLSGVLTGPEGIGFADNGDLFIACYNTKQIMRVNPTTGALAVAADLSGIRANPRAVVRHGNDWLIGTSAGVFRFNNDTWIGERLSFNNATAVTVTPDNRIFVADGGTNLSELKLQPFDTNATLAAYDAAISKGTTWLLDDSNFTAPTNLERAHRLIGLASALQYYDGKPLVAAIKTKMQETDSLLRAAQLADGGWGLDPALASNTTTPDTSDSLITAQVGFALDALNPSPTDPAIRKAIQTVLQRQQADGSWTSEKGILTTNLGASTWVEIWLPVLLDRMGGIDTDLSLTLPSNVTMANPDAAPTSTQTNADGSINYLWHLTGVTSDTRTIRFDLSLLGLKANETRAVASDAHLSFNNSFTSESVNAPIALPTVQASAYLAVSVSTDGSSYNANAPVTITVPVVNGGSTPSAASVTLAVIAPDGSVVANLGQFGAGAVAAGTTQSISALWNTSTTLAGGYQIRAQLYDAAGTLVSQASTGFTIGSGASSLAAASLTTDRVTYAPTDTVLLRDRLTNTQANTVLANLTLTTTVRDATGVQVWQTAEPILQLVGGAYKELAYTVPLKVAAAGHYTASLALTDVSGLPVASASAGFDVSSSAQSGAGLSGTVSAVPGSVSAGDVAVFSYTLSNAGNVAFSGLPLTVRIVDPNPATPQQALVAELPTSAIVAAGASSSGGLSWTSSAAYANKTLLVTLNAQIGAANIVLAQDRLSVTQPAVQMQTSAQALAESRLLVLVSCENGENDAASQNLASPTDNGLCTESRAQSLRDALGALNLSAYKVVTTRAEFETAFRCGSYNTYWLSGGAGKLGDALAREVRESVTRGNALIVDGVHDARNAALDTLLGVQFAGALGLDPVVSARSGGVFGAVSALQASGLTQNYQVLGGTVQAVFGSDPASTTASPAIVSSADGAGRSVVFAFNLASLFGGSNAAVAQTLLLDTLALTQPQTGRVDQTVPGAWVIQVRNAGAQSAYAKVEATLPAGFTLTATDPMVQPDAQNVLTWSPLLQAGETRRFVLHGSFTQAGAQDIPVVVTGSVTAGGSAAFSANLSLHAEVADMNGLAAGAANAVGAFKPLPAAEASAVARAVQDVAAARSAEANAQFGTAYAQWVAASDELRSVTSLDPHGVLLSVSLALQASERRFCAQYACLNGALSLSVAGQTTQSVPLASTLLVSRTLNNACTASLSAVPVNTGLSNRRTGAHLTNFADSLGLSAGQSVQRDGNWLAQGQDGDLIDVTLTADWTGASLALDRKLVQVIDTTPRLKGGVSCLPVSVARGQSLTFTRTVRNKGAYLASAVPVSTRIVNITQAGKVVQSWSDTLTLAAGGSDARSLSWALQGNANDLLAVEVVATVGGKTQILARTTTRVAP